MRLSDWFCVVMVVGFFITLAPAFWKRIRFEWTLPTGSLIMLIGLIGFTIAWKWE